MAINPQHREKTKTQKFGAIAFIFGMVIFLLSGLCTLGFEISILVKPPQSDYDKVWLSPGIIFAFGAAGFLPAGLLALLGRHTKNHGNNIWVLIAMGIIMAIFAYFFLGFVYYLND